MLRSDYALILFAKNARLGKVKSRLAATVGPQKALAIYEALLERIRQVTAPVRVTKYLYYSDEIEEKDAWDPALFLKRLQRGEDLGARMKNAIAEVLTTHGGAILIGSDIPGITTSLLNQAFRVLKDYDLVIGSTEDGGYYLIGMRQENAALFDTMAWSTDSVFTETMRRIQNRGLTCYELPRLADIDKEEDWIRYGWELE